MGLARGLRSAQNSKSVDCITSYLDHNSRAPCKRFVQSTYVKLKIGKGHAPMFNRVPISANYETWLMFGSLAVVPSLTIRTFHISQLPIHNMHMCCDVSSYQPAAGMLDPVNDR